MRGLRSDMADALLKAKLQLVEVEWEDSASTHGWRDPEDATKASGLACCRTAGYLLSIDRKSVRVVQSKHDLKRDPNNLMLVAEVIAIPRSVIRKIRVSFR